MHACRRDRHAFIYWCTMARTAHFNYPRGLFSSLLALLLDFRVTVRCCVFSFIDARSESQQPAGGRDALLLNDTQVMDGEEMIYKMRCSSFLFGMQRSTHLTHPKTLSHCAPLLEQKVKIYISLSTTWREIGKGNAFSVKCASDGVSR